jgi:hypothetical protein
MHAHSALPFSRAYSARAPAENTEVETEVLASSLRLVFPRTVADRLRVAVGYAIGSISMLGRGSVRPAATGMTAVGLASTRRYSTYPASRLGPPPRQLSPALRGWAMKRFAPRIGWRLPCIVTAIAMLGGVSFVATSLTSTDADWMFWVGISWIVLDVGGLTGVILLVATARRRRGRLLLELLECGTVRRARVLASQVDYAAPVNGAPKLVVALEIEGCSVEIRAFDYDDADLFPAEAVLEVLYAASIPDMVFPTSGIPAI